MKHRASSTYGYKRTVHQTPLSARPVQYSATYLSSQNTLQICFINTLNAELNPTFYLLALLGAQNILHVSRDGVKHQNV